MGQVDISSCLKLKIKKSPKETREITEKNRKNKKMPYILNSLSWQRSSEGK